MNKAKPTTEQSSKYDGLEKMGIPELLYNINKEDQSVPLAVEKAIPLIHDFVTITVSRMELGGRLFYIGAGTSGRLGVLDASECPPTFGVSEDWIIGIIAGGDGALRKAIENAEDDMQQAWKDLKKFNICDKDVLLGIAASGTTPYVLAGLLKAKEHGVITGSISCNKNSVLSKNVDYPIELIVGPEFITGSTRMKSRTAQKSGYLAVFGSRKTILQITDEDYNNNGMAQLVTEQGTVYDINLNFFNQLQHSFTGWPCGKPNADDSQRPKRAEQARNVL